MHCTLLLPQGHEDIGTSSSTRAISRLLIKTLKSMLHHFNDLQLLQIIRKMYTQIQVVAFLSSIYLITRHQIPVSKRPFYIHKTHVLFSRKHGRSDFPCSICNTPFCKFTSDGCAIHDSSCHDNSQKL